MILKRNQAIILGWSTAVVLIAVNIAYVSSFTGFIHPAAEVLETDHYRYLEMARGPEIRARSSRLAQEPPFCWRLLIPFLAYLTAQVGLGLDPAFFLITNVFLVGFLFVFYLYLRQSGAGTGYSLLGITLVALTPGAVRWYEYQYWMTDPAGLFLVTLGFALIHSGKTTCLLAVGVIAVAARETYLAVLVYYFFYLWKRHGFTAAVKRGWLVFLLPVVLLVLIRQFVITSGSYDIAEIAGKVIKFRLENFWESQFYLLTVGSFGVILPLLFLFPARLPAAFRDHYDKLIFVLVIYSSLTVGYNTDRLLAYTLPVLLIPALGNLKKFIDYSKLPAAGVIMLVIALQIFFYLSTRFYGYPAISIFQPASLPVAAVMLLFWILSWGIMRRRLTLKNKIQTREDMQGRINS